MVIIDTADFEKHLCHYFQMVLAGNDAIKVQTETGSVILLSEEEYNGLLETLSLTSISGMTERLIEGQNTSLEDSDVFEW